VDGIRVTLDSLLLRMGRAAKNPMDLLEMSRDESAAPMPRPSGPPHLTRFNGLSKPYRPFDANFERPIGSPDINNLNELISLLDIPAQGKKYPPLTKSDLIIVGGSQSFDRNRDEIESSLIDIANSQACSDAFQKYGLRKPYDIIRSDRIKITSQAFLRDRNASRSLQISQASIDTAAYKLSDGFLTKGAATYTVTESGQAPVLVVGQNILGPKYNGIKSVLIHEFIHAAGMPGNGGGLNGDLTGFKGYKEIEEACGGKSN